MVLAEEWNGRMQVKEPVKQKDGRNRRQKSRGGSGQEGEPIELSSRDFKAGGEPISLDPEFARATHAYKNA